MGDNRLRILQVNSTDNEGGAARVAWSLTNAYRERGHDAWLAVGRQHGSEGFVRQIPNRDASAWSRFWWGVESRLQRLQRVDRVRSPIGRGVRALAAPRGFLDYYRGRENFHYPGTLDLLTIAGGLPDVIHAHNLHGGYFDLRRLPSLSQAVPLILTLHDAWLLSGHCAHSLGCDRWTSGCGRCPDLTIYPAIRRDATADNWRRKQQIYDASQLYVATPCRWLMNSAEKSMLARGVAEARIIPNGVDLSVFQPGSLIEARGRLGIPQSAHVLLFTANAIQQNIWKDFQTMRQAIASVAEQLPDREVIFIGLGDDAPPERVGRAQLQFVPYQDDPHTVARYYQAADVYIHAARAETFPLAILEAMACGKPVVATAVGGIPEQVDDRQTGFLVPVGDTCELTRHVIQLLSDETLRHRQGASAVDRARGNYDIRLQADAYLRWYGELIERVAVDPASGASLHAFSAAH